MTNGYPFTKEDIGQIEGRGLSLETALDQFKRYEEGCRPVCLVRPCRPGDGIRVVPEGEYGNLIRIYDKACRQGRCMKFVPASGAASRMFEGLIRVLRREPLGKSAGTAFGEILKSEDPDHRETACFIQNLRKYAFYQDLKRVMSQRGIDAEALSAHENYVQILSLLLTREGLDYEHTAKALIPFHSYGEFSRTPLEEHLEESIRYGLDERKRARIHFTVPAESGEDFKRHAAQILGRYEKNGIRIEVGFSSQKSATDTLAAAEDHSPFRDINGRLVFYPGGHGALIENLNDLKADIVLIKNIDNVTHDGFKDETVRVKKILGGLLLQLQERIFYYLIRLHEGASGGAFLDEAESFISEELGMVFPEGLRTEDVETRGRRLTGYLNRPIRVCGVVTNQGEPGGGPFWVRSGPQTISRQIVEQSQVDFNCSEQRGIWRAATHFNPVDLVCGVRDWQGRPFDLKKFVEHDAFFISNKSRDGKKIKVLELPGLWNGGMSEWITIFAEVPRGTFHPVKTVNALLEKEHQPPSAG